MENIDKHHAGQPFYVPIPLCISTPSALKRSRVSTSFPEAAQCPGETIRAHAGACSAPPAGTPIARAAGGARRARSARTRCRWRRPDWGYASRANTVGPAHIGAFPTPEAPVPPGIAPGPRPARAPGAPPSPSRRHASRFKFLSRHPYDSPGPSGSTGASPRAWFPGR